MISWQTFLHAARPTTTGNFSRGGNPADQRFIRVAAASAQPVIEMGDGQLPPLAGRKFVERVQQHHRIQSAGDGDQNRLPGFEQLAAPDVLFDVLKQTGHALMLLHPAGRARSGEVCPRPGLTFVNVERPRAGAVRPI